MQTIYIDQYTIDTLLLVHTQDVAAAPFQQLFHVQSESLPSPLGFKETLPRQRPPRS